MQAGSTTRSRERARVSSHGGSDASLKRRQVGTGTKNNGALAEWTNWQTRAIQPCLRMSCAVLAIRAAIGAAIREHGIALGDSRFGVEFNPSRNPRIADIKRRAADLIDAIETIAGENRPSEIARFKALTVTDIGAVAMWTAKAAAQSERRVTRLVTYRVVAPAPHVEVPHTTPAARLDRCPPRDPNPTRRCVAPRTKTASRHTPSTSSPRHAGRAKAPDAAARWRRPPGPQVTSTRPHPRRPRRPHAGSLAPVEAHRRSARRIAKSHPCTTTSSTPAFARPDPRRAPRTELLDASPRARNRPRRRRKCLSRAPRRMDRHNGALRARHAPGAQRALQHRHFGYNILWLGPFTIEK